MRCAAASRWQAPSSAGWPLSSCVQPKAAANVAKWQVVVLGHDTLPQLASSHSFVCRRGLTGRACSPHRQGLRPWLPFCEAAPFHSPSDGAGDDAAGAGARWGASSLFSHRLISVLDAPGQGWGRIGRGAWRDLPLSGCWGAYWAADGSEATPHQVVPAGVLQVGPQVPMHCDFLGTHPVLLPAFFLC